MLVLGNVCGLSSVVSISRGPSDSIENSKSGGHLPVVSQLFSYPYPHFVGVGGGVVSSVLVLGNVCGFSSVVSVGG